MAENREPQFNDDIDTQPQPELQESQESKLAEIESRELKSDVEPNYTNKHSVNAEIRMKEILDKAKKIGVIITDIQIDPEQLIELTKHRMPDRFRLVCKKLKDEGLEISNLPKKVLIDRLLGVDATFSFNGKNYAVDVTSGKHTVIKNKEKKFAELEKLLRDLGIDYTLIIRIKQEISDDVILDLFTRLEQDDNENFCKIFRYPETKL